LTELNISEDTCVEVKQYQNVTAQKYFHDSAERKERKEKAVRKENYILSAL
jgi:hypothetical protein